jgi:hypothetical protein
VKGPRKGPLTCKKDYSRFLTDCGSYCPSCGLNVGRGSRKLTHRQIASLEPCVLPPVVTQSDRQTVLPSERPEVANQVLPDSNRSVAAVHLIRTFAGSLTEEDAMMGTRSLRCRSFGSANQWRVDMVCTTSGIAAKATSAVAERTANHTERWSDHAPVTVAFDV